MMTLEQMAAMQAAQTMGFANAYPGATRSLAFFSCCLSSGRLLLLRAGLHQPAPCRVQPGAAALSPAATGPHGRGERS